MEVKRIPTPFSNARCRICGSSGSLIACSAPGCSDYQVHSKCHRDAGGFLLICITSQYAICLCQTHKLRVDSSFLDNHLILLWLRKLAGLPCQADPAVVAFLKDAEPNLVGKTLNVAVKVTDGSTDWFRGLVKRQRSKCQVLLAWENGDDDEWIDLKSEVYKIC